MLRQDHNDNSKELVEIIEDNCQKSIDQIIFSSVYKVCCIFSKALHELFIRDKNRCISFPRKKLLALIKLNLNLKKKSTPVPEQVKQSTETECS